MERFTDLVSLESALGDLGALLAEQDTAVELCVIGGAAFLIQEPDRFHSTADVDIAGIIDQGALLPVAGLPEIVERASLDVARLHGLNPGWISAAAGRAFGDTLLPDGFVERAHRRSYGSLTLLVAARIDLIRLKFLAAVERRRQDAHLRHVEDIRRARPSVAELDDAQDWVASRLPDAAAFADRIRTTREEVLR